MPGTSLVGSQTKQNAFDTAIEAFTKVTELQPGNAKAWAGVSRVYARKSDVSEGDVAAECVKKAKNAYQVYECIKKATGETEIAACIEQHWVSEQSEHPPVKKYSSCAEMHADWPKGVNKSGGTYQSK